MTIIGLYFHLASIIISLTYLNSFALVSVFFVFFTNIVTRLFEDEKSIIVISSVVGTLMPFGGFMDNAIKTVLYTINLGNFHTILHSDEELRFMYENGQGHLTLFCIVFV